MQSENVCSSKMELFVTIIKNSRCQNLHKELHLRCYSGLRSRRLGRLIINISFMRHLIAGYEVLWPYDQDGLILMRGFPHQAGFSKENISSGASPASFLLVLLGVETTLRHQITGLSPAASTINVGI